MVDHYVQKVNAFTDEYLATAAGLKFKEDMEKSRRNHSAKPSLDPESLVQYGDSKGLPWGGVKEVFDFFDILSSVGEVTTVEQTVN
jgi:hypothetical protein